MTGVRCYFSCQDSESCSRHSLPRTLAHTQIRTYYCDVNLLDKRRFYLIYSNYADHTVWRLNMKPRMNKGDFGVCTTVTYTLIGLGMTEGNMSSSATLLASCNGNSWRLDTKKRESPVNSVQDCAKVVWYSGWEVKLRGSRVFHAIRYKNPGHYLQ